jgi:hypothetical protein
VLALASETKCHPAAQRANLRNTNMPRRLPLNG